MSCSSCSEVPQHAGGLYLTGGVTAKMKAGGRAGGWWLTEWLMNPLVGGEPI